MITIIIPVFNNINYTKKCIESIYKNTDLNIFHLLIINNASTDETEKYLNSLKMVYSNFDFIQNEKNLGFAKACNQGAEFAQTEKILFLNNDTLTTPNWLKILNDELDNNLDVKIVGSKLLYEDDTVQHAGIVFSNFKDSKGNNLHYHIYRFFPSKHPFVNKKRYFQALTGACILTYKDFFMQMEKFNENYLNGSEDVDFCLKAIQHGAKILYCPESVVYHFEAKTDGRFDKINENLDLFYSEWNEKIITDDFKYFGEDGLNLIEVIEKEEIFENYINDEEFESVTMTSIDFFYEKNCKKSELAIFIKDDGKNDMKELILSINANITDDFSLFLIGDISNLVYLKEKFCNLDIIESKNFNVLFLANLVKNNYKNMLLISSLQELNFALNEKLEYIDTKRFLELYENFESINNENFEYWQNFFNIFEYDNGLKFLFAKYYSEQNEFKKVLDIISQILRLDSKNLEVKLLLSQTLEQLGDFETAKKIKKTL